MSFKKFVLVVAATVLATGMVTAPAAATAPPRYDRAVDFDTGWQFSLVNTTGDDAGQPSPDDPSWRNVDLPHDWSIGLDPTTGAHTNSGTGFLPGGLGWYRKTFTLSPELAGKKLSIEFDGVYMDSEVFLNGHSLGKHPYGYTGFSFDLTPFAHTDGTPDVMAVKVRNQVPSSRWYSGSGIYRNVRLVVTDPIHVTRHGNYVTTPNLANTIRSGYATVHVETTAVNESGGTRPVDVESTVKDKTGHVVARKSAELDLGADAQTSGVDLRVDHPTLWSTDRPYLYTVDTQLRSAGKVVDTTTTRFGIRWFAVSASGGFTLNGKETKLYGVDLHHDLGALGAAVNRDALRRQMTIMKSMGVNAFRTSHNPPSPEMIQVCEELGIVMMVEAFDTWRTPKVKYDYGRFFDEHSDADVREMVNVAKNSPAVVLWSIGNEIPDSTSTEVGLPIAKRLIADVKSIDSTRPIVMGSDKYRSVPAPGSAQDQILQLLDGMGLNYNTAGSVDALHDRYPTKFFFESESSSATSTRGVYQDPELINTGENYTPGKRSVSSYDNNMASWTMSGEYGLKKDRDRKYFAGQFLWSGIDYIGEPTPYDVFPVKASFFGAVDTAGFAKDMYYLFQSQWTTKPMVHLLPMNWTDHEPGEPVSVWAYSNADTVELFLNGRSLGARSFDRKTTTDGKRYLETTEATFDDKTVVSGPYPGSYTSPNGSAGKLHLTWNVPYAPGRLVAVAKRNGVEVAEDVLNTAGAPAAIKLTPDRKGILGDGKSLAFVTAEVVDSHGSTVPGADNAISFQVAGGKLAGLDNGREESAENYQSHTRTAFNGKALAIVQSGRNGGPITITARSQGLKTASATVETSGHPASGVSTSDSPTVAGPAAPTANASFSGAPTTLPAAMLDGVTTSGGWSNHYAKSATALLPAISKAHAREWVSVSLPSAQEVGTVEAYFTTDASRVLPSAIAVSYWNGRAFVPFRNPRITWGGASNQPTTITFAPVRTTRLKLDLTSPAPGTSTGFLQISELRWAT